MNRYWVSWNQPTEDYRPLHWPPNHRVLGWWCSGYFQRAEMEVATLCAVVQGVGPTDAAAGVLEEWPEAEVGDWRFFRPVPADFLPGDRFPLSGWMAERLKGVQL